MIASAVSPLRSYPEKFGYVNGLRRNMRKRIGEAMGLLKEGKHDRAFYVLAFIAAHSDECDEAHPEIGGTR